MWQISKVKLLVTALIACFMVVLVPVATVSAIDAKGAICDGVGSAGGGGGCDTGGTDIGDIVKLVVNILSLVAGIAAVIMIIVGGLKYITSSGDPSSISSAKNTIIYAVIGIIVVVFSQMLVRFVFFRVS